MWVLDIFKKKESKKDAVLKETYPDGCIELVHNRVYLEWFFDVYNNNMGRPLEIVPNCPHCLYQYRCAVGIHAGVYLNAINSGYIKINQDKQELDKPKTENPQADPNMSKSRFSDIDLVD